MWAAGQLALPVEKRPELNRKMAFDIFAGSRGSLAWDGADAGGAARCANACIASARYAVGKAIFAILRNLEANILSCLGDRALQAVIRQLALDFIQRRPDDFLQEPGLFGNTKVSGN